MSVGRTNLLLVITELLAYYFGEHRYIAFGAGGFGRGARMAMADREHHHEFHKSYGALNCSRREFLAGVHRGGAISCDSSPHTAANLGALHDHAKRVCRRLGAGVSADPALQVCKGVGRWNLVAGKVL